MDFFYRKWNGFKNYTVAVIAKKICHKKVIKNTASFGPISNITLRKDAKYFGNVIFDKIIAREIASKKELSEKANVTSEISYSPDTANLMPYTRTTNDVPYITISVSYRIKMNWKSREPYIDCITTFIRNIVNNYNVKIKLLPNENHPGKETDIKIAKEIQNKLTDFDFAIEVVDSDNIHPIELKSLVASSEIVVASRYHTCVAALSSGTPLITVGWHYKYKELLELYDQQNWHLSSADCTSDSLIKLFEEMWNIKSQISENILSNSFKVKKNGYRYGEISLW